MNLTATTPAPSVIAWLRQIARPPAVKERCEFCHAALGDEHRHLKEVGSRNIICACDPCAMLFQREGAGRYKLIPRDPRVLADFQMTDSQWEGFHLPINLTFFYRDSAAGRVVAMYPSAAGVTESLLPAENWQILETDNRSLADMTADVEALLVNRVAAARDYFIAPIDVCYELSGLIRMHWRGFSGGEKVWEEIDRFFAALREKARPAVAKASEAVHV